MEEKEVPILGLHKLIVLTKKEEDQTTTGPIRLESPQSEWTLCSLEQVKVGVVLSSISVDK